MLRPALEKAAWRAPTAARSAARRGELARQYQLAEGVIGRLSRIDSDALRAIADGITLDLDSAAAAEASAVALKAKLAEMHAKTLSGAAVNNDGTADVYAQFDEKTDKHRLMIARRQHGNVRLSHWTPTSSTAPTTPRWPRPPRPSGPDPRRHQGAPRRGRQAARPDRGRLPRRHDRCCPKPNAASRASATRAWAR